MVETVIFLIVSIFFILFVFALFGLYALSLEEYKD